MNTQPQDDWYDPEATTFGDRLSGAREEAGMTQQELAQRLGVKIKTLKAWEDDLSEPRANKLSMMAGMLNVSLSWLLTGEGEGPMDPAIGDLSPDVNMLLEEFRDLQNQMAATSDRLGRLERELRSTLKVEAID
ncbi:helix-turn-helix domain-containing protein [Roseovarius faecimaris]|uniref:Helix-turn-helix domain-containing protein n=1 Tax=Roseovarius faecimaris TaxID=2494550 RepID=A0A6I6IYX6_9RHOB|nr:helix-turn-helix domain-containing protein [Roseovarius faecimaris]QGX97828.1 helix-turn-helix domain-containing protein [Roseovarius faecimaris]